MDAGAGPDGVAHATLSPDGGASTCAARPADPFVAVFCRLNRPNPYRRFTDTACRSARGPRAPIQQRTDGGPGDAAQAPQTPDVWASQVRPPPTACPPRRLSRHGTSRSLSEKEAAWRLAASLNTTKIYI